MERNQTNKTAGTSIVPRSFFRFPSFLPTAWEEIEDRLSRFGGLDAETGVTVSEDAKNVYVEAQLPGMSSEDLDISYHQNTLWIKGERKEEEEAKERKYYRKAKSSFFYQVELPSQIEEGNEQAHFENGILKVAFKKTQQGQVRKINVCSQSSECKQQNKSTTVQTKKS